MTPRTMTAAAALGLAALAPSAPPAQAAPLLTIEATFAGTDTTYGCQSTSCTYTHSSDVCYALGVNGTGVPYAGGCTASLTYTVRPTRVGTPAGNHYACAGAVTDATFTFGLTTGVHLPMRAKVVVAQGVAKWTTDPYVDVAGYAYAGTGSGTVKPACLGRENVPAVFTGKFEYAHV